MDLRAVLKKMVQNPRGILNIAVPQIEAGTRANLTIFNTDEEWTLEEQHLKSKSKNTPYLQSSMVGRAEAIYNNGQFIENSLPA